VTLRPTDRPAIACRDVRADTDDTRQSIDGSAESPASSGSPASPVPGADRFVAAVAVDGEVLFAGPSVPAVLGIERATLVGDDLLDYVHPNDREPVSDALSAVATNRVVTHRLRHANGGFVWVESVVDEELAPSSVGASSRCVASTPSRPSRSGSGSSWSTARIWSPSSTRTGGSGTRARPSRRFSATSRGRPWALPPGYVHPDDRERVTERFYRALNDPDATPTMEYRYRTADGNWVWLESRSRSLPDDVAVGRLLINSRDVSERKARERRLTDRNERLDRFASIVSHDLRNPLSVIRGSMEMAELNGDTEPLERGERAVDRIDQLVSELLTLARQGSGIDEPTEFALGGVAREAWDTAGSADATLVLGADARVCGDRGRLRQVFENLFRNATEHAAPDGTDAIRSTDSGEDAPLTVLVTATGGDFSSPTTDRGSIRRTARRFDPGFTTREDGTGYGLDIVREVVESHGWTIGVRRDGTDPACPDDVTVPDGACFVVGGPDSDAADADEPWIDG